MAWAQNDSGVLQSYLAASCPEAGLVPQGCAVMRRSSLRSREDSGLLLLYDVISTEEKSCPEAGLVPQGCAVMRRSSLRSREDSGLLLLYDVISTEEKSCAFDHR